MVSTDPTSARWAADCGSFTELEREALEGMESRVEQLEQIRRDQDQEGMSIRSLAVRHGVYRRTVKQALFSPVPPASGRRWQAGAEAGAFRAVIDVWLLADREAPLKQRHTAKRIWQRLVDAHGADVAEVMVRQYLHRCERGFGLAVGEVFVPQVHRRAWRPGSIAARRRWCSGGVSVKVHLLVMRVVLGRGVRSDVVGRDLAGFLELQVQAFEWFGGVFAQIRFVRERFVPTVPDGYVKLDEAARQLGVARQTVLNQVRAGRRKAVMVVEGNRRGLQIEICPGEQGLLEQASALEARRVLASS